MTDKNDNILNSGTLEVLALMKSEVSEAIKPLTDDIKECKRDIKDLKDDIMPQVDAHEIYIQNNRSDIEVIKNTPKRFMQYIFWVAVIVLQLVSILA